MSSSSLPAPNSILGGHVSFSNEETDLFTVKRPEIQICNNHDLKTRVVVDKQFFVLALALTSPISVASSIHHLAAASTGDSNAMLSWQLDYATISSILQFVFHLSMLVISASKMQLPLGLRIVLLINFFNIAHGAVSSVSHVTTAVVVLPNDALSLATLLIFLVLLAFAFRGNARVNGMDDRLLDGGGDAA